MSERDEETERRQCEYDYTHADNRIGVSVCELVEVLRALLAKDAAMAEYFGAKWPADLDNTANRARAVLAKVAPEDGIRGTVLYGTGTGSEE